VSAGNYLPGVPRANLYAEVRWRHAPTGFAAALEVQRKSRVWVNDVNSEAADGYGVANLALGFTQQGREWRVSEFLRVDNLADRRYAGSVIVNDANNRFYEPAPGRNVMLGLSLRIAL
jgi:iron complex outermembrane receptor protein